MTPMDEYDDRSLASPLGETSPADPDDVLRAKHAFRKLGYYKIPSYGLTPYPDQPLFNGIRAYQKDKDLIVDGLMMPGGETEQSVNNSLAGDGLNAENGAHDGCAEEAVSILPGYPWIRRRNYCPIPSEKPSNEDCRRKIEQDEERCRKISARYGSYRAQRCYASAYLRHGNCIAGRPDFPDLDTGEY